MLWRNPAVRVLLLLLAFGVAGMHTLGHHEGHHGGPTPGHGAHAAENHANPAVAPPTGDLDPSAMCLAILTAGVLLGLVLAALRTTQRIPVDHWRPRRHAGRRTTRGPPDFTAAGLFVAKVAVLRI